MSKVISNAQLGNAVKQRRFKLVPISIRAFTFLLKRKGIFKINNFLPKDVIDCGAFLDSHTDTINIRIASMKFEPIKEGEIPPRIDKGIFFTSVKK